MDDYVVLALGPRVGQLSDFPVNLLVRQPLLFQHLAREFYRALQACGPLAMESTQPIAACLVATHVGLLDRRTQRAIVRSILGRETAEALCACGPPADSAAANQNRFGESLYNKSAGHP